jgi:Mn2+/Fe2+ NRAMP family transporter
LNGVEARRARRVTSQAVTPRAKPRAWRRWLAIALRTGHTAGVVLLGAALYGAAVPATVAGGLTLVTGIALMTLERADGRLRFGELAGAFAVAKLALVVWMTRDGAVARVLFWALLAVSGIVSHAPRPVRHWQPWR